MFDELAQYVGFEPIATPLTLAAFAGRVDVLPALLAEDVSCSQETQSFTCLHAATAVGNVEVIELLVAKGFAVDATDRGGTTSHHEPSVEALMLLIDKRVIDLPNKDGYTPLHCAVNNLPYLQDNTLVGEVLLAVDRRCSG